MKHCSQCSQPCEDASVFCASCGAAFPAPQPGPSEQPEEGFAQPVSAPEPETYPQYPQPPYPQSYGQPGSAAAGNPVRDTFKRHASSKAFLMASLLFSAVLLFNLITAFIPGDALISSFLEGFEEGFSEFGELPDEFYDLFNNDFEASNIVSALIGNIPAILTCIGLWLIYAAGASQDSSVKMSGLSMLRGVTIFKLVLMFLIPVLLMVIIFLSMSMVSMIGGYDIEDTAVAIVVVVLVVLIACLFLIFPILYYIFLSKMLKSIRVSMETGQPVAKVSTYVVVCNYILAGFLIIGFLTTLGGLSSGGNTGLRLLNLLSSACNIAFLFVITGALLKYKAAMLSVFLRTSPLRGPVPQTAYTPFPPPAGPNYPPPPQYANPYAVYEPPAGMPPSPAQYAPPPAPKEYVFCDICFKQFARDERICPHCGAPKGT